METFAKTITVTTDDLDELKHVNNVRYVQWIQDISKEHWQKYAPITMQQAVVWVVMKHTISYKGAAVLDDQINIKTHISNSKGATCVRVVEMHDAKTNKLILYSETEWCLLNSKTFRPIRISEEIKTIFSYQEKT